MYYMTRLPSSLDGGLDGGLDAGARRSRLSERPYFAYSFKKGLFAITP